MSGAAPLRPGGGGLVSFVVIAWNAEATLRRCVVSILAQPEPREVIVVDNGSTDGTVASLAGLAVTLLHEPVRRRGAARNRGMAAARGDYLAFVDADVELPPDWAPRALGLLAARPEIAGVGGPGRTPENSWVARALDALQYGHRSGDDEREVPSLATMDVVYRAEAVRGVRFLHLWAAEDPEFNFRLTARGKRLLWSRQLTVLHHHPITLPELLGKAFRYGMWFPAPYWHHREQITPDVLLRLAYVPVAVVLLAGTPAVPAAGWLLAAWLALPIASYALVALGELRSLPGLAAPRFVLVHSARQYAQMLGIWAGALTGVWREFSRPRDAQP